MYSTVWLSITVYPCSVRESASSLRRFSTMVLGCLVVVLACCDCTIAGRSCTAGIARPLACLIERTGIMLPQTRQNTLLLSPAFGTHWLRCLQFEHCRPFMVCKPIVFMSTILMLSRLCLLFSSMHWFCMCKWLQLLRVACSCKWL